MKLVSYSNIMHKERLGLLVNNKVYDLKKASESMRVQELADNMLEFLQGEEENMKSAHEINEAISKGMAIIDADDFEPELLAPVPHPTSCRDGYAFRQHVAAARRNRKVDMISEFDEYPIFYFTNHNAIQGQGDIRCMPDHFKQLDFELEAAVVIGKKGRNIKAI